jgi:hypothetical protein
MREGDRKDASDKGRGRGRGRDDNDGEHMRSSEGPNATNSVCDDSGGDAEKVGRLWGRDAANSGENGSISR